MKMFLVSFFVCVTVSAQIINSKKTLSADDVLSDYSKESRNADLKQIQKNKTALPTANITLFKNKSADPVDIKLPKFDLYVNNNEDQAAYEKTLDTQIKELFKLTQEFKTSEKRGELWLRLAELYIERANLISDRIENEFDKKKLTSAATGLPAQPDFAPVKVYNHKAKQLYELYLKDFSKAEKVDLALFYLAYQNYELGNIEAALGLYSQLVSQFPSSRYTTDSHFIIAENYFDNEKWAEANKQYEYVIAEESNAYFPLALYKSAWCLFRTDKANQAISYLKKVIKLSNTDRNVDTTTGRKVNTSYLENEAIRDLVIFFADVDMIDEAISYFNGLNSKAGKDSIKKLAYYLSSKGNIRSSKKVFKYLIAEAFGSADSFDFQFQIVQNYFFSQKADEFKNELHVLVQDYGKKSKWYALNRKNAEFIKSSDQKREEILRNYILKEHQNAQNTHAQTSFKTADEAYKFYLQEFPDSAAAAEMNFLYGELLYDLLQYSGAATQYEIVVERYPSNQYHKTAYLYLLLSLEKSLPAENETQAQKKTDKSLELIALDSPVMKFIKYAEIYLKRNPSYEKSADIKFRIARLYYINNHFDEAEKYFKEIVKNYPDTKYSEYSANLLLDIYSLRNDYVGLEKNAAELLAVDSISKSKLGDDIRAIIEKTNFKKAQDLDSIGQYLNSALQYLNFTMLYPASKLAAAAYYNAAVNFEKVGNKQQAMVSFHSFVKNEKATDANLKHQANESLAKFYQDSGQYELSAKLYTALINDKISSPALIENYIFNSALMYELIADNKQAIGLYETFYKVSKNNDEKTEVVFKLAELYRKQKATDAAFANYKKYLEFKNTRPDIRVYATYWVYFLSKEKKLKVNLMDVERDILKALDSVEAGKREKLNSYLVKVKMAQSFEVYEQLKHIQIPNQANRQQSAVDKKLELMNILNSKLTDVIKLESPEEIVGAFYLLGLSSESIVDSFKQVSIPKDLNAEEKTAYLEELNKIISPFAAKAEESFKLAVEKGRALNVYNQAYAEAFKKLNYKYPQEYVVVREVYSDVRIFKTEKNSGKADAPNGDPGQLNFEALLKNPNDIQALLSLSDYYYEKKQYTAAEVLLRKALIQNSKLSEAYNRLGVILLDKDEVREAIQMFELALKNEPEYYPAAANLSSLYIRYMNYPMAYEILKSSPAYKVENEMTLNNYAILWSVLGEYRKSEDIYKKILKINTSSTETLLNYSILLLEKLKKPQETLDQLNKIKHTGLSKYYKKIISDLELEAKTALK